MGLFQEYVNSKGKIAKPVVDISGDQLDPRNSPNCPPKGGKPYIAKGGKSDNKKALGDQGDADLKYTPSKNASSSGHPPAKIPTAEQVEICAFMADAMERDFTIVEQLVTQLKRKNLLGPLVGELLNHKATYQEIADVMAHNTHGPNTCIRLVRAMNEEIAPPFSDALSPSEAPEDEEDLEDEDLDGEEDDLDLEDDDDLEDMGEEMPPEMAGQEMDQMPPEMGGQMSPDMMGQQPMPPQMPPAMANMQRAMMRRYMQDDDDTHLKKIGLERVFPKQHQHGDRVFYDPREGKYWDRHSDIFMGQEDLPKFGLGPRSNPERKSCGIM